MRLIKSIPDIIQLQTIRLDIFNIKDKIITTIEQFISKLLKSSE
jgi:hypothetical protein